MYPDDLFLMDCPLRGTIFFVVVVDVAVAEIQYLLTTYHLERSNGKLDGC